MIREPGDDNTITCARISLNFLRKSCIFLRKSCIFLRRSDDFPRNNVISLRKYEIRSTENRQISPEKHCVSTENTTFLRNSAALLQNNTAFARKICYISRSEYYFLWKEDVPNGPLYIDLLTHLFCKKQIDYLLLLRLAILIIQQIIEQI